jgi:serine/threonine protein kinase
VITPLPGVVIARRYTLARPLARGAMGSVWVARHSELEIDVTVKFIDPSLVASADARARFEHEARSAARLDSQHVVQVLDYGIESDTPYMVMELLKGETLATRLGREGRLPLPAAARLVVQIGKALRTAHEADLVHRDLKPGNIFLAIKDEDEVAKVLDFGIAKTMILGQPATTTEAGTVLGSAHYMSPEQVRNSSAVDHRSDLWSLGVILYRTLVGRVPVPGKGFGDVMMRVCSDPVPVPSSIAPDLPARLDGFFARALARDPPQRFQTARELSEAFCSVAMDAADVPSPRVSDKRTVRIDLGSVPRLPSSSTHVGEPLPQTSSGTHIMHVARGGAAVEVEPTLKAAELVTTTPATTPFREGADDPPAVPVHSLWPAWAAVAALVGGGLIFVAFRAGGARAGAVPAMVASATVAPATVAPAASSAVAASAAAPQGDAGAAATTSAAVTAPSAPPSWMRRRGGGSQVKVEDGIIRDPFKP